MRLLPLLLAVAALSACSRDEPESSRRVLLIGIDGASPRVVQPLLERGELPHLAKLGAQGVSGSLRSMIPIESPRIWNSIATGKRPEKHGILSFARLTDDRDLRLYLASDRKVHALWNIVSDAGLSVGVVNWWNTFPPEKIHGVMVSDHLHEREIEGREEVAHATGTPTGAVIHPADWASRLADLVASDRAAIDFPDPFHGNDRLPNAAFVSDRMSRYFQEDELVLRMALEIEQAEQPDVMLVFFPGIDRVSHFLWGTIEPAELYPENLRPSPEARRAGREALERYYVYTDAMIGALVERYRADDLVMVVSDHGFEAGSEIGILTGVHRGETALDGVLFARGAGIPSGVKTDEAGILDITPTILAWLGLPVGEDMDGRPASFVGAERVERVATHDTRPIERLESEASGSETEILENLRALGYIDED